MSGQQRTPAAKVVPANKPGPPPEQEQGNDVAELRDEVAQLRAEVGELRQALALARTDRRRRPTRLEL